MNTGAAIMMLGTIVRVGAVWNYWAILVGNGIMGAGATFLGGLPAKVSSFWFRVNWVRAMQRTNSTTVSSVAMTLGAAVGMVIPTLFVGSNGTKEQVAVLMVFEAVMTSVVCIACFVFMRNKPPTPPSATATTKREEFWPAFKDLMRNRNYLVVLTVASLGLGVVNIFSTVVEVVTDAYGFTSVRLI